jgi:hypothetical protein
MFYQYYGGDILMTVSGQSHEQLLSVLNFLSLRYGGQGIGSGFGGGFGKGSRRYSATSSKHGKAPI